VGGVKEIGILIDNSNTLVMMSGSGIAMRASNKDNHNRQSKLVLNAAFRGLQVQSTGGDVQLTE